MSNNDFLVLKNITKSFGKSTVIDNLDLTIKRGTMVTLLGPSGCGKTTLIKIMSGLLYPNQGNVIYNGTNIKQMGYPNYRDNIALVLQEDHLF